LYSFSNTRLPSHGSIRARTRAHTKVTSSNTSFECAVNTDTVCRAQPRQMKQQHRKFQINVEIKTRHSKVGLAAGKAAALRINLNSTLWRRRTRCARSFSRSPSPRHPPLPQYLFSPRSLVCGGQTSPHKPRLVASHSTCPPLSPSAHAHSFVIGTVVNIRIYGEHPAYVLARAPCVYLGVLGVDRAVCIPAADLGSGRGIGYQNIRRKSKVSRV